MEYETHKQITQLCGHEKVDGTGDEHLNMGTPGWIFNTMSAISPTCVPPQMTEYPNLLL